MAMPLKVLTQSASPLRCVLFPINIDGATSEHQLPRSPLLKINLYCSYKAFRNSPTFSLIKGLSLLAFISRSQNFSISLSAFKSLMSRQYPDNPIALIRDSHL